MKNTPLKSIFVLYIFLILLPFSAMSQNVNSIVNGMEKNYNQMTDGINNFTVRQGVFLGDATEAMATTTTYYERDENGFSSRNTNMETAMGTVHSDDMENMAFYGNNTREVFDHLRQNAEYRGIERFYGAEVYVLYSSDPDVLAGADANDFSDDDDVRYETTMTDGFFYIGVDHYDMRGMRMLGESNNNGEISDFEMVLALTDFREVKGLRYPFLTTMEVSGMEMEISAEELAEAKRSLAELEKQLSSLPANLRSTMENMIKPQMAQFEAILQSGKITTSIKVLDLQVNAGRPSDR